MTTETRSATAAGLIAIVLALLGPLAVAAAYEVAVASGRSTLVVTPLAVLAAVSVFAFHVRFALRACEARAGIARVLGVVAFVLGIAGYLVALPATFVMYDRTPMVLGR